MNETGISQARRHEIQALPLIAKALGNSLGVTIHMGGSQACTNGKVITLPTLRMNGTEEELDLMQGYLDHEAAHVRYTKFDVISIQMAKLDQAYASLLHMVVNILEDIRIETLLPKEYPGTRLHLVNLANRLVARGDCGTYREAEFRANPLGLMLELVFWQRSVVQLNYTCLTEPAKKAEALAQSLFGADFVRDTLLIAERGSTASSTQLVMDAAVELLTHLGKPPASPDSANAGNKGKDQASSPGDNGASGQPSPGSGEGDSDKAGQPGASDDKTPSKDATEAESGKPGSPSSAGSKSGKGTSQKKPESPESKQAAAEKLKAQVAEGMPANQLRELRNRVDKGAATATAINEAVQDSGGGALGSGSSYCDDTSINSKFRHPNPIALRNLQPERLTRGIRTRLESALEARTIAEEYSAESGKNLIGRKLGMLKSGCSSVFRREEEGIAFSTAVSLLVDVSGSMSDARMTSAKLTAIAMGDALDMLASSGKGGVTFSVDGFDTRIFPSHAFEEPWRTGRASVAGMDAEGGTRYAPAMVHVGGALLPRLESRKLMVIITDGLPSDPDDAKQLVEHLTKGGIEVYFILIQPGKTFKEDMARIIRPDKIVAVMDLGTLPALISKLILRSV